MTTNDPRSTGAHPVEPERRKKRPWWLLLLLAAVGIIVLLLLLSQCGGDDDSDDTSGAATSTSTPSPTPSESTSTPATPTPSTAPSDSPSAAVPPAGGTTDGGTLTVGSTTLLPMSGATPAGDMTALAGQPATAKAVSVLTVPADEGFWVGTSENDRVWIQLTGGGESPFQVKPGDLVDFTGTAVEHQAGFAAKVGVNRAEGAAQLDEQGAHIETPRDSLTLSQG